MSTAEARVGDLDDQRDVPGRAARSGNRAGAPDDLQVGLGYRCHRRARIGRSGRTYQPAGTIRTAMRSEVGQRRWRVAGPWSSSRPVVPCQRKIGSFRLEDARLDHLTRSGRSSSDGGRAGVASGPRSGDGRRRLAGSSIGFAVQGGRPIPAVSRSQSGLFLDATQSSAYGADERVGVSALSAL